MKKRTDGRYVVRVSYEDARGVTKRRAFYGRTQAEAKANAEAGRARVLSGAPIRDASCTLSEWLVEWRREWLKASDRADSTKELYDMLVRRWVEADDNEEAHGIGHVRLDRLKPSDVLRVLNAMEDAGLTPSTRRNAYAAIRAALDDAVTADLLMTNPAAKVKRPSANTSEAVAMTPEQVKELLHAAKGLRYVVVLKFLLLTGLRRGEALAMKWKDVDLDRGTATVKGSLVRRGSVLTISTPKTKTSKRAVALSPSAVTLLKAQKAAQAAERLKAGNGWSDEGYVFTTEWGKPVDPRNLLRAVQIAREGAGLPDRINVHSLRHTYATTALLNNVPLVVVSANLGHSSIQITADVYGHVPDSAQHAAAEAVSAALGL